MQLALNYTPAVVTVQANSTNAYNYTNTSEAAYEQQQLSRVVGKNQSFVWACQANQALSPSTAASQIALKASASASATRARKTHAECCYASHETWAWTHIQQHMWRATGYSDCAAHVAINHEPMNIASATRCPCLHLSAADCF